MLAAEPGICAELIGFESSEDVTPGTRTQIVSAHGPATFRIAPTLGRRLNQGAYDVVHTNGLWSWASVAAASWARRTQRALIVSPHGMLDEWALEHSRLRKRVALILFERDHLSRAVCLHALTEAEARSILNAGFKMPIAVIPNGIDVAPAEAIFPLPGCLSGDNRQILLFLGRLHPKKGISPLLAAWAKALLLKPNLGKTWRLVIAGWDDGGHSEAYQRAAGQLGVGESVVFCGPLFGADKAAAYAHARAFILPSFSEGLPMTVLEAWSHSCAVFATKHCNLPEGFRSGAAIQITTDADEMAAVLVNSLSNLEQLADIGEAGRQLVIRQFTWARISAQWRQVYAWAAGRRPQAPDCILTTPLKAA